MDWNSQYIIPLYQALLVPAVIFLLGLAVEAVGNVLGALLAAVFGSRMAFFVRNRLTFVGTVHHELAHALFAVISGARVTRVELFRVRGQQLGCVEFYPRGNAFTKAIQITLSAIAPVVCGSVSLCALAWVWQHRCAEPWQYMITGYLMVSILFHMNMSTQDIKNAWKGMPLTILICYLVFLALRLA